MSFLAPLLEIQSLDLATDAARKRATELPERKMLPKLAGRAAEVEAKLTANRGEQLRIEGVEEELSLGVAQIAKEIEAAEVDRYSGKRKGRESAAAHDVSQEELRLKQVALEEEEMALLESMEKIEAAIEVDLSQIAKLRAEADQIKQALKKGEAEAATEMAGLVSARATLASGIPADVMAAYEKLRAQPRSGGRGATSFEDGSCTGCRITLPSLERSRMLAQPEEALLQCPQCRKVLVR